MPRIRIAQSAARDAAAAVAVLHAPLRIAGLPTSGAHMDQALVGVARGR